MIPTATIKAPPSRIRFTFSAFMAGSSVNVLIAKHETNQVETRAMCSSRKETP